MWWELWIRTILSPMMLRSRRKHKDINEFTPSHAKDFITWVWTYVSITCDHTVNLLTFTHLCHHLKILGQYFSAWLSCETSEVLNFAVPLSLLWALHTSQHLQERHDESHWSISLSPHLNSDGFARLQRSTRHHCGTDVPPSITERQIERYFREMRHPCANPSYGCVDDGSTTSSLPCVLSRGVIERQTEVSMQQFAANSTLNNQLGLSWVEKKAKVESTTQRSRWLEGRKEKRIKQWIGERQASKKQWMEINNQLCGLRK